MHTLENHLSQPPAATVYLELKVKLSVLDHAITDNDYCARVWRVLRAIFRCAKIGLRLHWAEDTCTRGHNRKPAKKNCRRNTRLHFCSQRAVNSSPGVKESRRPPNV